MCGRDLLLNSSWTVSSPDMDVLLLAMSSTYASAGYLEVSIFLGILILLFKVRYFRTMLDVFSTRFQDAKCTAGWGEPNTVRQSSAALHHQLTQFQLKRREQMNKHKTASQAVYEHALFNIKEAQWGLLTETEKRPFVGLSCEACTPSSRKALPDIGNLPVVDILRVDSLQDRPKGILAKLIPDIMQCLTLKKYHYPYIYETVLNDETLQESMRMSAEEIAKESGETDEDSFNKILGKQKKRALKILTTLRSTLSDIIIRISSWVFYKTLPLLFTSMSIPPAQLIMLKKAAATGLPLIFLPLHRSHVDYIAVTFTLCNNSIRSPLVAAGENLRIPIFGWILRGLGAFFIKRRMDPESGKKDKLYRTLLHTYMTQCIEAGHYFEFFIEGGRTRTGKPCMPKGGLLSVFVDAYLSGVLQDALLVPVSVNYERLVDGSFVREQTGESKQPETFKSAISGIWSALTRHYGTVRVDFNQPFSLNELVRSFQSKVRNNMGSLHVSPSTSSLYGTDIIVEEQRQLVDCIARHILYDCSRSTAVMSTNALAFLLLNVYRNGVQLLELALALDKLREELKNTGKDTGFTGESIDVIEHAVKMLGPGLVLKERSPEGVIIKPVTMLPNVIELAYYSNTVIPHFVLEGIVGASLQYLSTLDSSQRVNCDKLLDTSTDLCEILQFEFLFTKTCQNLNDALFETVDKMATMDLLTSILAQKASAKPSVGCPRNLDIIDDEDDDDYHSVSSPIYKVNKNHPKLVLYGKILMPLIDTYTVTARALYTLVSRQIPEREFIKYVLSQIRSLLDKGVILHGESLSTDSVRNCLKLFEKWSIVDCHNQNGIKLYYLNSNYDSEFNLEPVIERIQRFQSPSSSD